ncbi:membrane protein of ER body-like protein isoform X2 [Senna tora]|uniref:Membrane protein of ER body-like protein isoform X2 n=1 Tax=Senna tora TaxID=362788 RepID=A0A834T9B8_9FABA|nr:membrane protein of ER body-like protein isoform X2 [Senna tora]
MDPKHQQEHQQWMVMGEEEQEVEEAASALEGRQTRKQLQDDDISSTVLVSSSSPVIATDNGGAIADLGITTNGVSSVATDQPIVLKEEQVAEMSNDVCENGTKAAVGLGLVAEFEGPTTNGEAIGSEPNNRPYEVQNGDGARSVLLADNGRGEFKIQIENPDILTPQSNEVNNGPLSSESSLLHDSSEIKATDHKHVNNGTSKKAGSETSSESSRLKEIDVKEVLAKQETYDLICPKCNSCITKRVILRKRKRNTAKLDTEPNPDELDATVSSELVDNSLDESNQGGNANSTSITANLELSPPDDNPVQDQAVFRCLECFSIFIPRGNGFFKFLNFGGTREHGTSQVTSIAPPSNIQNPSIVSNVQNSPNITVPSVQNPSSVPASNGNWFISLFTPNKGKTVGERGKAPPKHSKAGPAEPEHSLSTTSDVLPSTENGHADRPVVLPSTENGHADRPVTNTTNDENGKTVPNIKPGHDGLNGIVSTDVQGKNNDSMDIKITGIVANLPSKNFSGVATAITSEEPVNAGKLAKDGILKPYEGDLDFPVASNVGSEIFQKPQNIDKTPEIDQNGYSSLIMQAEVPAQSSSSVVLVTAMINTAKFGVDAKPAVGSDTKAGDVILSVEDEVGSAISQTGDAALNRGDVLTEPANQVNNNGQAAVVIGEHYGWEILKSIVYGGLIESITSLGIVSSAVSSGAAPLNIIALGLANLVGGLFLIGENLIDMKNDKSGDQQQTNAQDRYQELLGRRANFLLHAVVAVLSFLIFGSVPIVIYGILINTNYQPEVKLSAVVASSLICIILLAIGKVYTKTPPKSYFKTVLYYLTMALAASGVSFIAGALFKDLLEKFNHSDSGFVITMPSSGSGTTDPAWGSY